MEGGKWISLPLPFWPVAATEEEEGDPAAPLLSYFSRGLWRACLALPASASGFMPCVDGIYQLFKGVFKWNFTRL